MTEYSNLEQNEFHALSTQLADVHEQELNAIKQLATNFRNLLNESFQTDKTSAYALSILDLLDRSFLPCLEQRFELTEQELGTFTTLVNNTDTLGGI